MMIQTIGERRIVNLSSIAHEHCSKIDFDDFHFKKPGSYGAWASYGQAKSCNVLFTRELNRKLQSDYGAQNFISVSLHPGGIQTELTRDVSGLMKFAMVFAGPFLKSIPQGAATTIYAAISKDVKGGEYLVDANIAVSTKLTQDMEVAKKLWSFSEKETGVTYDDIKNNKLYN